MWQRRWTDVRAVVAAIACACIWSCSGGSDGDSPTASCQGSPTPCADITTSACTTTPGCYDDGSCVGIGNCLGMFDKTACESDITCTWSPLCTGTRAETCVGKPQAACALVLGCQWTASVPAAPGSCDPGAEYNTVCAGTAVPCPCGTTCSKSYSQSTPVCAYPCQSTSDCRGRVANGQHLYNCSSLEPGYGTCSAN